METDNKLFNNIQSKVSVTLDDFESLKRYFIPLKAKKKTNVIDEGNYNDCLYLWRKAYYIPIKRWKAAMFRLFNLRRRITGFLICAASLPVQPLCFPSRPLKTPPYIN